MLRDDGTRVMRCERRSFYTHDVRDAMSSEPVISGKIRILPVQMAQFPPEMPLFRSVVIKRHEPTPLMDTAVNACARRQGRQ